MCSRRREWPCPRRGLDGIYGGTGQSVIQVEVGKGIVVDRVDGVAKQSAKQESVDLVPDLRGNSEKSRCSLR